MENKSVNKYKTSWGNCKISYYHGDSTVMSYFHSHKYYEVSLIISGCIRSLLCDRCEESTQSRLVLTAPGIPHFIYMTKPSVYKRINLCFTVEFLTDYVPEWRLLEKVFGQNGNIIMLTDEQCNFFKEKLDKIHGESDNSFRQRLLILDFLSHISDIDVCGKSSSSLQPPFYVVEALTYIQEHYPEHIVAADLAWKLGISRTTLMTAFKKHTDLTLAEYITRVRVKKSISLLRMGESQETVAEQTGLGNGGGLIRAFRHCYDMTPKQYMKKLMENEDQA